MIIVVCERFEMGPTINNLSNCEVSAITFSLVNGQLVEIYRKYVITGKMLVNCDVCLMTDKQMFMTKSVVVVMD